MDIYEEPANLSKLYKTLQAGIEDLQKQAQVEAQKMLDKAFASFFDKYGEVVTHIYWTQYTPYHMDGDACEFSVNDVWAIPATIGLEDPFDYYEEYTPTASTEALYSALETVKDELDWEKNPIEFVENKIAEVGKSYFGYRFRDSYTDDIVKNWQFDRYTDPKIELATILNMHMSYPDIEKDFNTLVNFIESIDESYMKMAYGDHSKVLVSKNGTEVEEWEHD